MADDSPSSLPRRFKDELRATIFGTTVVELAKKDNLSAEQMGEDFRKGFGRLVNEGVLQQPASQDHSKGENSVSGSPSTSGGARPAAPSNSQLASGASSKGNSGLPSGRLPVPGAQARRNSPLSSNKRTTNGAPSGGPKPGEFHQAPAPQVSGASSSPVETADSDAKGPGRVVTNFSVLNDVVDRYLGKQYLDIDLIELAEKVNDADALKSLFLAKDGLEEHLERKQNLGGELANRSNAKATLDAVNQLINKSDNRTAKAQQRLYWLNFACFQKHRPPVAVYQSKVRPHFPIDDKEIDPSLADTLDKIWSVFERVHSDPQAVASHESTAQDITIGHMIKRLEVAHAYTATRCEAEGLSDKDRAELQECRDFIATSMRRAEELQAIIRDLQTPRAH